MAQILKAPAWLAKQVLVHSARTTVAATVSIIVARAFRLPESHWAAITTLVVMQSTLGAARAISERRFAGTALGAAMGAVLTTYCGPGLLALGAGLFAAGLICAALRLDQVAYRFAGITMAIVILISRNKPVWVVALDRFIEVSIGIGVGLLLTMIWPERHPPAGPAEAIGTAT